VNTRNMRWTIGGPESPIGSAESRTYVIPVREKPGFREQAEKLEDPAITGVNMVIGEYLGALNLNGGLPLSPRPCGGFGKIINSALGQEGTPTQIAAVVRIRYGGSEDSAKISASASGDTLTSEIGDDGDESGDAAFGTAGTIDLTDGATDTVTELVAVIDAYTHYEAELVTGSGDTDTADIVNITAEQGKGRWVYIYFSSADSGLYLHKWPVVLTNTARPGYSVQADGIHDNFLGTGVVFDSLSISGSLKALVEDDTNGLGFSWTGSQEASALELESVDPFLFYNGAFSINGVDQPFIRNIAVDISNNHNAEGYGMGSSSRQYHDKGMFNVTATIQAKYDSDIYALAALIESNAQAGMDVYFKTPAVLSGSIHGLLIIEAPYCNISDYEATDNGGALDASINIRVINKSGAYGDPFRITMITDDSAAY